MKFPDPHASRNRKRWPCLVLCVSTGVAVPLSPVAHGASPVEPSEKAASPGDKSEGNGKNPSDSTPTPAPNQPQPKPMDPNPPDGGIVEGIMPLILPEIPQNDGVLPIFPDIDQPSEIIPLATPLDPTLELAEEIKEEIPGEEEIPEPESNPFLQQNALSLQPGALQPSWAQISPLGSSSGSFSEMPGFTIPNMGNPMNSQKGLSFNVFLSTVFDNNATRSADTMGGAASDLLNTAGLGVTYQSIAKSPWNLTAAYNGGYTYFWDNHDLNAPFHSANGSLNYQGARLQASFFSSLSVGSGQNREVAQVVDQINYAAGVNARYTISKKTSLDSSLSYATNLISGNVEDERDNLTAQMSGIWHYSPLTDIGLGARYSQQPNRNAFGPYMSLNYRLSQIISLRSQVALELPVGNDAFSQTTVDINTGLNYRPSTLWSASLDLRRSTQPQLGVNNSFRTLTGLRLGYTRRIAINSFSAGIGYEMSENISSSSSDSGDQDFFTLDASLSRPLFDGKVGSSLFIRYAEQSGGSATSFDSLQVGFNLSYSF